MIVFEKKHKFAIIFVSIYQGIILSNRPLYFILVYFIISENSTLAKVLFFTLRTCFSYVHHPEQWFETGIV